MENLIIDLGECAVYIAKRTGIPLDDVLTVLLVETHYMRKVGIIDA